MFIDAVLAMSERAATTPLKVGLRVMRGPDWKWNNQDGGEGHLGTVIQLGKGGDKRDKAKGAEAHGGDRDGPVGTVILQWDNGTRTNYRAGHQNAYDLRVVDNGPVGVKHPGVQCKHCQSGPIFGIRWRCSKCSDKVDLCSDCYHGGRHDLSHEFRRFDSPDSAGTYVVSARRYSRRVQLKGLLPGAKVERTADWTWSDQDGGPGNAGDLLELEGWESDTARSVAKVFWSATSQVYNYRVGHRGKIDLKCQAGRHGAGGHCFVDHLPVLGQVEPVNYSPKHCKAFSMNKFTPGDRVQIAVDLETLRQLQEGHGGFNSKMSEILGKLGRVHRITNGGDIRVQYPGKPEADFRWTVHPAALSKISAYDVGDMVRVLKSEDKVRDLQSQHGLWTDDLRQVVGQMGRVISHGTGDLIKVAVVEGSVPGPSGQHVCTLAPQCVERVASAQPPDLTTESREMNNVPSAHAMNELAARLADADSDRFVAEAALGRVDKVRALLDRSAPVDLKLVRRGLQKAALSGHLAVVRLLADRFPDQVDLKCGGKTALQVAVHQGHLDVVDLLLSHCGAQLTTTDDDGDCVLHYAAFGKQPTVLDYLLERGCDVNAVNGKQCTPLHVAVVMKQEACARVLIKHKADANLQDGDGDTPLHEAIGKKSACDGIVQLLLPVTDLALKNASGFNSLQLAALKGNVPAVKGILALDASLVNVKKADGVAPLHLASLNGNMEVTRVLLTEGRCQMDVRDNMGQTPLHHACMIGYYALAELLLHNGGGGGGKHLVNSRDSEGNTALHLVLAREGEQPRLPKNADPAASVVDAAIMARVKSAGVPSSLRKWVSIAMLLVINGGDATLRNRHGYTAFDRIQDPSSRTLLLEQSLSCSPSSSSSSSSSSPSSSSSSQAVAASSPGKKRREAVKVKRVECQICLEMVQPVEFRPCGHAIVCADCCVRMKKCLQCKAVIDEKAVPGAKSKMDDAAGPSSAAPSTARLKDLEAKMQDLEDQYLCAICMERRKHVVFMCGHGTCSECVETLKVCHMCRGPIAKKIFLY